MPHSSKAVSGAETKTQARTNKRGGSGGRVARGARSGSEQGPGVRRDRGRADDAEGCGVAGPVMGEGGAGGGALGGGALG